MPTRDFPAGTLGERARAYLAGEVTDPPAEPRLAATVQLLRDGADGLEVFVLRRVASMAFAPSALVFPGGGVDPRDADGTDLWFGPHDWGGALGLPEDVARGVVVAAAREVFEETGVLLASRAVSDPGDGGWAMGVLPGEAAAPGAPSGDWAGERRAVESRELAFSDLLGRHGLGLRADLLALRAHWVTPEFEPRRYDTYFFAAVVPDGQEPDGDTSEADDARWVRPADALGAHARGELPLLPPTVVALEDLARFDRAADVLGDERPVPRVQPTLARVGDDVVIRVASGEEP